MKSTINSANVPQAIVTLIAIVSIIYTICAGVKNQPRYDVFREKIKKISITPVVEDIHVVYQEILVEKAAEGQYRSGLLDFKIRLFNASRQSFDNEDKKRFPAIERF